MPVYSDIHPHLAQDAVGNIKQVTDIECVTAAYENIIGTKMGERPFRRSFGVLLDQYVFESCDAITAREIKMDVAVACSQDSRILIKQVNVQPLTDDLMYVIQSVFDIRGLQAERGESNTVLKVE